MASKIQLRRDSSANWTTNNPTLLQGEWGRETNTGKIKIGDGATAWNSLAYYSMMTDTQVSNLSNAVLNGDSRLTDARTPTTHASTHVTGGSDKIRDASASQDGLMTIAYGTKLNNLQATTNLITNGSFSINERGLPTTPTAKTTWDHTIDVWQITDATNVTTLNVRHVAGGGLRFSGTGNSGQIIHVRNRCAELDKSVYNATKGEVVYTAKVNIIANTSVAFTASVYPTTNTVGATLYTNSPANTGANGELVTPVLCRSADMEDGANDHAYFRVVLDATGSYDFTVTDFAQVVGRFDTPATYVPMHIADELARCKRYFQKGVLHAEAKYAKFDGTATTKQARIATSIQYPVEFGANPTPTLTTTTAEVYDGAGAIITATGSSSEIVSTTSKGFVLRHKIIDETDAPRAYDNGGKVTWDWTASID